jgi:glycosyltransferase involved in cell wall biosynthesis
VPNTANTHSAAIPRPECSLRASIVVPCRDRAKQLASCLAAISQLNPSPLEVIVVDSGSRDRDAIHELTKQWNVRYFRLEQPGVSRAKNAGAMAALGDVVAYLDDDAVPASDWLSHLLAPFEDSRIACVTGRVEPDPRAKTERARYELLGYVRSSDEPKTISRSDSHWFEMACFGGIGISPNLAVRREMFERGFRFNERLGLGTAVPAGEEGHLFLTLVRQGFVIRHIPEALVFHPVPAPSRESLRKRYGMALSASTGYLLMIICEESGCRWSAFKYLLKKCRRGVPLWSRVASSPDRVVILSPWRVMMARACGVPLYGASLAKAAFDKLRNQAEGGGGRDLNIAVPGRREPAVEDSVR